MQRYDNRWNKIRLQTINIRKIHDKKQIIGHYIRHLIFLYYFYSAFCSEALIRGVG